MEKRNLVIEGQHDPITVQHLSAIRLSEEYWQSLIDKNVISLEVPAEITLKPRSPIAEKEIAEAERHEQTDYEKIENMLDKSLKIFFNRMENKLDTNVKPLKKQIQDLSTRLDSNINPIKKDITDLSFACHAEITNRQTLESKIREELNQAEIKQQQRINSKFTSFEKQFTEVSESIRRVQDHLDHLEYECQQAKSFRPTELTTADFDNTFSLGQLDEKKPLDPPPSERQKDETIDEILERIKKVWPKDDIYTTKGSAGASDSKLPSGEGKTDPPPDGTSDTNPSPGNEQSRSRGRSRTKRGKTGRNASTSPSSDRSLSPFPTKQHSFSGDPTRGSWSSFSIKIERIAERHKWSENKKLDRLFSCLTEKALEYAVKCKNNKSYENLNGELKLRFDSSDEPVAARQKLHLAKQSEDETLEVYMQRILSMATDGFGDFDNAVMQQMAIEAFLRGCQNKEAASFVLVSTPSTIQDACRKMKMFIANKKAVDGNKVSFQERLFTAQEEKRVSDLERKVSDMTYMIRSRSPQRPYTSSYRYPRDGQSYDRYRQNRRENNTRSDRYSPSPSRSPSDQYRDRYKTPFYGHQHQGGGRYPSQSPSNSSTRGSSEERYNSSRENSPKRYPSPNRYPRPPDGFREGYQPPRQDRYSEDYRSKKQTPRDRPTKSQGSSESGTPKPYYKSRRMSSEHRNTQDLNLSGLGVPATSP